jgi:hypothetical protein
VTAKHEVLLKTRAIGVALVASLILSAQGSPQELCATAKRPEVRMPPPGSGISDPCDGLRLLLPIVAACAAEYPEDQALQRYAADILQLEREQKIEAGVLASMRKMAANPQSLQTSNIDPTLFARRIAMVEAKAAEIDADLAVKRSSAAAAGYSRLSEEGFAQAIISNAVWRYLLEEVRRHVDSCTDDAGRRAARELIAGLAVMASHGDALEREVTRRILLPAPK